jgi:OmpA-OmpF porin, OOP family
MAGLKRLVCVVVAAAAALWLPLTSDAQTTSSPAGGRWWSNARGYLGLSVGGSHYGVACGGTALVCDDTGTAWRASAGLMANNYWGVELGYIDLGKMARAGGQTKAQGLNLSLVGRAPVWQSFSVFGKLGATYGRTETSTAGPATGVTAGTERGMGLSYGVGIGYDFTPRLSATLEWDSNDFRFAGTGRDQVRSTSLGLQYRY